jgi:hypothetical protein
MLFSNFVMVERDDGGASRFFVTHSREPRFCIEVDPSYDPLGQPGRGFIKGIRINNSWSGDYQLCLSFVREAEEFFRQSVLGKVHRQ